MSDGENTVTRKQQKSGLSVSTIILIWLGVTIACVILTYAAFMVLSWGWPETGNLFVPTPAKVFSVAMILDFAIIIMYAVVALTVLQIIRNFLGATDD